MFLILFLKILPNYFTLFIGYLAGKFLKIDKNTISKIIFYIASPIVILHGISHTNADINLQILSLPILIWLIGSTMSLFVYYISSFLSRDSTRNILAFSSGSTNMGSFGLPVAVALFDEDTVSLYIVCYIGMVLFENSLGFYIAANGIYSVKECILKLVKLPSSYSMILGFILNAFDIVMPTFLSEFMANIRSTFVVLGMILLGVSVANIANFRIEWKFVLTTITVKYVLWPLLVLGIVFLDRNFMNIYDESIYKALMLLSIIPVSGSSIILANILNYQPDKTTLLILISNIVGLFYVPMIVSIFFTKWVAF